MVCSFRAVLSPRVNSRMREPASSGPSTWSGWRETEGMWGHIVHVMVLMIALGGVCADYSPQLLLILPVDLCARQSKQVIASACSA